MNLVGIIGWKNSGKTGLVERLVAHFTARGVRMATLKHTHHGVDLDPQGTDTARHRAAGAAQVMLASDTRLTLMTELSKPEPLETLAQRLGPVDLIIAEGWKGGQHFRIESYHTGVQQPPLALRDPTIQAVATDSSLDVACPVLPLNDTEAIADFITEAFRL